MKKVKTVVPEGMELIQEGNTYKLVEKKFELKVGRDYKHKRDKNLICIDRKENALNFGFHGKEFECTVVCSNPSEWEEATKKEVVEAFEKECVRRYGEGWKDIKVGKAIIGGYDSDIINKSTWQLEIIKCNNEDLKGWIVWNHNGVLYYNGEWNEPLEEEEDACINHEPLEEGVQLQTDDAKPEYYKQNDPFKIMEDNCTEEEIMGAIKLNILKYTLRNKGQNESDFHKIKAYADWGLRILKDR